MFERISGYALLRSLTQQVAGDSGATAWKPAIVQFDDGLVPGLIIEEHDDGNFTLFVPSVPRPLAGAVYMLGPERVHAVDVPFTPAIQSASRWGSGSRDLVAARRQGPSAR